MKKKANRNLLWFSRQLQLCQEIIENAEETAEMFSESEKRCLKKIMPQVEMIDLQLIQLNSPTPPPGIMTTFD